MVLNFKLWKVHIKGQWNLLSFWDALNGNRLIVNKTVTESINNEGTTKVESVSEYDFAKGKQIVFSKTFYNNSLIHVEETFNQK
jgi:hypothetical protein